MFQIRVTTLSFLETNTEGQIMKMVKISIRTKLSGACVKGRRLPYLSHWVLEPSWCRPICCLSRLLFGCCEINPEFTFAFKLYFGSTTAFLIVFLDIFQRILIISTHLYVFFFWGCYISWQSIVYIVLYFGSYFMQAVPILSNCSEAESSDPAVS